MDLKDLLDYNPATGVFTWRVSRRKVKAGSVAGTKCKEGYIRIEVGGKKFFAHRLAWFFVHGVWHDEIDHRNLIRDDNRIENLRPATHSQNQMNKKCYSNSKTGHKGVSWKERDKKYQARIQIDGKSLYLGYFNELDDAVAAVEIARAIHHKGFSNK